MAYGPRAFASGSEGYVAAAITIATLHAWRAIPRLFGGRRAAWYSATARRRARAEEFREDLISALGLLRKSAIRPG